MTRRRIVVAAVAALTAATAFIAPRSANAQTVGNTGPCIFAPGLNTMTLTGGLTAPLSGISPSGYTKHQNGLCAVVGVNGLVVSEGLAPLTGDFGLTGFSGDCLVSAGPFPQRSIAGVQVFIGDAVNIGVSDFSEEVNFLTPQTTADLPCSGTGPTSVLNMNYTGEFQFMPAAIP